MNTVAVNMWSTKINREAKSDLKAILIKQATELGRLTKNIAEAKVSTYILEEAQDNQPLMQQCFDVVAPILGHSEVTIMCIKHKVTNEFPCSFFSAYWDRVGWQTCNSKDEFNALLSEILSSDKTTELVNSFIAQSMGDC
jgi:hypothetical protein